MHFAPTEKSKQNLLAENIAEEKIIVTGNTVVDALFEVVEKLKVDAVLNKQMQEKFEFLEALLRNSVREQNCLQLIDSYTIH